VGKYSNWTQNGRGNFVVLPHKNAMYSTAQRKLILKKWAGRQNYNHSPPVFCLREKEQVFQEETNLGRRFSENPGPSLVLNESFHKWKRFHLCVLTGALEVARRGNVLWQCAKIGARGGPARRRRAPTGSDQSPEDVV